MLKLLAANPIRPITLRDEPGLLAIQHGSKGLLHWAALYPAQSRSSRTWTAPADAPLVSKKNDVVEY
jgi:hypothetical protein